MLFASLLSVATVALAQTGAAIVNTPTQLTTCQPAAITFSGGTAPYIISVLPGGQVSAAPIESFPSQAAAGSYTWNVNIAAGTSITLQIRDATGVLNYSQAVTILAGSDTSCVGVAPASASAASGSAPAASSASSSASASSAAVSGPSSAASASAASTAVSAASTPSAAATSAKAATSAPSSAASTMSMATGITSTQAPAATTAKSGSVATSFNVAAVLGAAALAVLA